MLFFLLIGNIWLIVSYFFFFAYRKYLVDVIVLCILGLKCVL